LLIFIWRIIYTHERNIYVHQRDFHNFSAMLLVLTYILFNIQLRDYYDDGVIKMIFRYFATTGFSFWTQWRCGLCKSNTRMNTELISHIILLPHYKLIYIIICHAILFEIRPSYFFLRKTVAMCSITILRFRMSRMSAMYRDECARSAICSRVLLRVYPSVSL